MDLLKLHSEAVILKMIRNNSDYNSEVDIHEFEKQKQRQECLNKKKCNKSYSGWNFLIFLKIITVSIAFLIFIDLNKDILVAVKIFKGIFVILFSEIYILYTLYGIYVKGY